MLLVINVGNTNTGLGVFTQTLLQSRGIERTRITAVAISNVVPPIQQTLEEMCQKYFGLHPFSVEPGVNTKLPLRVESPQEVGPDRVVEGVAAVELYGRPLIVIDFGTATTFDCVNSRGEFVGGADRKSTR